MNYKRKRRLIIGVSLFLLLIVYLFKNFSLGTRVIGFIFGFIVFYAFDDLFKIDFKLRHYSCMFLILLFGILLSPLYFVSENYDKILHLLMPILGSFLLFYIIDKQKLNFQWKILITFMFVVSFLTIHEIGEYLIDVLWDFKLQGVYLRDISGLEKFNLILPKNDDTMIDLILGVISGLLFVFGKTVSFFYNQRKLKI
ncbi:hypothetical protein KAT80_03500 [Candidatus Pacearchaeota archaeon]|nr:hypothetical protein [Candidatus Pacearchaeota archaeon]